ncbi:MAG: MFS transporter [Proteobacteria bacterium]|nr:MFS transporter [Pseudomonadota bacterium]MBU4277862.1 MFS transporter [Pseudomonadota bacterium]MBU4384867.1 MFS transporter [Pseudomonadota bacterium]MCG2763793.1 MFS transporter [Desulfarculaceae bacterium]
MKTDLHNAARGRAWAIFATCLLGFNLSMFHRVSITVISPELSSALNLTASQLGDLSAAFFYGFALCQIPLGMALDRLGARWVMPGVGLVGVIGAMLFAGSSSPGMAVAARAMIGVGMSCNLMGAFCLFAAWFPPGRFATIAGLYMSLGVVGQLIATTPLVFMSQALGWRGAFWVVSAVALVQVVAQAVILRERPPGVEAPAMLRENPLKGLGQVLKLPAYWIISLGQLFRYGCTMTLLGLWGGPYLIYALDLNQVQAGNALLCAALGTIMGLPVFGRLSDSLLGTRKWVVLPALFLLMAQFLTLGFLPHGMPVWVVYGLLFFIGLASSPGQLMFAHIRELVPAHLSARAMTATNLFLMIGPALVMQISGLLVFKEPDAITSSGDLWGVWLFMVAGLGLSGCAYLFVPDSQVVKKYRKNHAR